MVQGTTSGQHSALTRLATLRRLILDESNCLRRRRLIGLFMNMVEDVTPEEFQDLAFEIDNSMDYAFDDLY